MHPQLLREIVAIHNVEAHELAARRQALRAASSAGERRGPRLAGRRSPSRGGCTARP